MTKLTIKKYQKSTGPQAPITRGSVIKIGIDVHISKIVAVRIIDGSSPQRAQRFTSSDSFLRWMEAMVKTGATMHSCYEAGPLGFVLHRRLEAIGVSNVVIRPFRCDRHGQRVKTDKRDAAELAQALDRWVAGNRKALSVVRVPTEAEEKRRVLGRQREQLKRNARRVAAQGRSLALQFGYRLKGTWWKGLLWESLRTELPDWLVERLEVFRTQLSSIEPLEKHLNKRFEDEAPKRLPKRIGALTWVLLAREICCWSRFSNRRQVSSYTGLVPCEDSSGDRRFQGSINKHGNPRVRCLLIQTAWRMWNYQPDYLPVKRWRQRVRGAPLSRGRRKQIIVAIARQLAVDLWRLNTDQTIPEKLGMEMKAA